MAALVVALAVAHLIRELVGLVRLVRATLVVTVLALGLVVVAVLAPPALMVRQMEGTGALEVLRLWTMLQQLVLAVAEAEHTAAPLAQVAQAEAALDQTMPPQRRQEARPQAAAVAAVDRPLAVTIALVVRVDLAL